MLRFLLILFTVAGFPGLSGAQQAGSADPWSPPASGESSDIAKYRSIMQNAAKAAAVYLKDEHRLGLFLSSTALPSTGRVLIIDNVSGARSSCSGFLVAPQFLLTAGHCVCSTAPSAAACQARLSSMQIQVFFPTAGLFETTSSIKVNPGFRLPNPIGPGTPSMADLAILQLAKNPGIKPSPIAKLADSGKVVLSSFGFFAFTDDNDISRRGFTPGVQYMDGVEQLSGRDRLIANPQGCGRSQTPDTLCTEPYAGNLFSVSVPSLQTTAICEGDSGGPLYQAGTSGFAAVGLVSYYYPQVNDCTGEAARRTHAVDLNTYRDWIFSITGPTTDITVNDPSCIETIFGAGNFVLPTASGSRIVSLTTFDTSFDANSDANQRPKPSILTPGNCTYSLEFGVASCKVSAGQPSSIKILNGLAQVALCVPSMETAHP